MESRNAHIHLLFVTFTHIHTHTHSRTHTANLQELLCQIYLKIPAMMERLVPDCCKTFKTSRLPVNRWKC